MPPRSQLLAIGLRITIMKVLEVNEAFLVETGDWLCAKRKRGSRAVLNHDVRSRARQQPSIPR